MGRAGGVLLVAGAERPGKKLIQRVVDVVDADEQPPAELVLAWQCERWHALPLPGGMFDQDYRLIRTMAVLLNIHTVVSRFRRLQGEQIHSLSDSERSILGYLVRNGML